MKLIPTEEKFFDLFEAQADNLLKGAQILHKTFEHYTSVESAYLAAKEIREIERTGDSLVHEVIARLNKTFVTPVDREDIFALTGVLDDVLDYVDSVAERLVIFRVAQPTPHAVELSRIVVRGCEEIVAGVKMLRNLKRANEITRQCESLNALENDADQVLREGLAHLFSDSGRDPLEVIKWKDIYEHLEIATDKCEDVANIFETVLMKYA